MNPTTPTTNVRFMKHFLTNGTHKARVHYSLDNRTDRRNCVTLYAKGYQDDLKAVFPAECMNGTDLMTDYFEKDRVVLFEDHPLYTAARTRAEQK